MKNSEKCNSMLEVLSEVNALKRKSEEQVDDLRKLEETLKLLKEKKRKLQNFYLRFLRFISSDHQVSLLLPFRIKNVFQRIVQFGIIFGLKSVFNKPLNVF